MRVSNECGWESFHTSNAGVGDDVEGGKPAVTLRHCVRGKLQKLPVAALTVTGPCAQRADRRRGILR